MIVEIVCITDDHGTWPPGHKQSRYIRETIRFITDDHAIIAYVDTYGQKLSSYYYYIGKSTKITPENVDSELAEYIFNLCDSKNLKEDSSTSPPDLIVEFEHYCD